MNILKIFKNMVSYQSDKLILVISKIGEEINNETALYYLINYINKNKNKYKIRLHVLLIDGIINYENRKKIFFKYFFNMIGNISNNILVGSINNIEDINYLTIGNYNQKYILQIAPYHDLNCAKIIKSNLNNYYYFLLGEIGKSSNSNGNNTNFTYYLYNNAKYNFIIKTKINNKIIIPYFTYNTSFWFGEQLQEEILKFSFKKIFGREPPNCYTAHLVGHNGSNYENIKLIYETITNNSFENIIISNESNKISLEYFNKVNQNNLNNKFRQEKYKLLNQNEDLQIIGLSRIVEALHILFNFPKNIYYYIDPKFDNLIINFNYSWNIYLNFLKKYPDIPLTHCYDLIASIAVIKNIQNLYNYYFNNYGVFIQYNNHIILKTLLNEFI